MIHFNSPFDITLFTLFAIGLVFCAFVFLRSKKGSASTSAEQNNEQVYVGNLSYRIREGQLRQFFEEFGDITNVRIIKNHNNGRSKGFGFVTFSSDDEAQKALSFNGAMFCGRPLVVRIAKARS